MAAPTGGAATPEGPWPAMMRPLVCIGWDGATWDVLGPLLQQGHLPFLAAALDGGVRGDLRSTIPPITAPAVPTMFTGLNPGKTGLFTLLHRDGSPVSLGEAGCEAVWDVLSRAGRRSLVGAVPFTAPPHPILGIMLSRVGTGKGWAGRDHRTADFTSYPAELTEHPSVQRLAGLEAERAAAMRRRRPDQAHLATIRLAAHRELWAFYGDVLPREEPDVAILWDYTSDEVQHWEWGCDERLAEHFAAMDRSLQALAEAHPEASFVLVSDHGCATGPTRSFYPNSWLRSQGLARPWRRVPPVSGCAPLRRIMRSLVRPQTLSRWKRAWVRRVRGGEGSGAEGNGGVPPEAGWLPWVSRRDSRAYHADVYWGIHINHGLVPPEEAADLAGRIAAGLRTIRDPEGREVVLEAWPREAVYCGPHVEQLPDVVFLTLPEYCPHPYAGGGLFGGYPAGEAGRTGAHYSAREGILAAWGPGIGRGQVAGDVQDIAPTLLWLAGVPLPDDLDGRPLVGLASEATRRHLGEPTRQPAQRREPSAPPVYAPEELAAIEQRLRSLGYVD